MATPSESVSMRSESEDGSAVARSKAGEAMDVGGDAPVDDGKGVTRAEVLAPAIIAEKKAAGKLKESRGDRKVTLVTNHVAVTFDHDAVVHQYSVEIEPLKEDKNSVRNIQKNGADDATRLQRRQICYDVVMKALRHHAALFDDLPPENFVYDRNAILYCTHALSSVDAGKPIIIEKQSTETRGSYKITVFTSDKGHVRLSLNDLRKQAASRDLAESDFTLQQFLETATNQSLFDKKSNMTAATNRVFYMNSENKNRIQNTNTYQVDGFSKSVADAEAGVMMCIEPKSSAMWFDCKVIDLLQALGLRSGRMDTRLKNALSRTVRGMRMAATHRTPSILFTASGVSIDSARNLSFDFKGRHTTVYDYFKTQHNLTLQYPDLPCIVEKKPQGQSFFPVELLKICKYQRVTVKQQTPEMQREMIRSSAVHPEVRLRKTEQAIEDDMRLSSKSLLLKNLKIVISREMARLEGRVLGNIRLRYGRQGIEANAGKWMCNEEFYKPAGGQPNYAVLSMGCRPNDTRAQEQCLERWSQQMQRRGVKMGKLITRGVHAVADLADLRQVATDLVERDACDFIMVFIPSKTDDTKGLVKMVEMEVGCVTQCVAMPTVMKSPNNVIDNIVAKSNMKLGGLNYILDNEDSLVKLWMAGDVLFISYDVSKPPPLPAHLRRAGVVDDEPAVVGIAATTGSRKELHTVSFALQSGRHEEVLALDDLVRVMVERYKKTHDGRGPSRVIVYRDGVSQGEHRMVLSNECPRIEKAIDAAVADQRGGVDITFVVCTKRHDTRFFLDRIPNARSAAQKNIAPGTVVDSTITSRHATEFYLCSHVAFQGTAKAIKYTVLRDDSNMKLEDLQTITWILSHGHQIIQATVSKPAVCMAATNIAKRGRELYATWSSMRDDNSSVVSGMSDRMTDDRLAAVTKELTRNIESDGFYNAAFYA